MLLGVTGVPWSQQFTLIVDYVYKISPKTNGSNENLSELIIAYYPAIFMFVSLYLIYVSVLSLTTFMMNCLL